MLSPLMFNFCGMGGLEADAEESLWDSGVLCWNDYRLLRKPPFSTSKHKAVLYDLDEAEKRLEQGTKGIRWFYEKLPPAQRCRILPYVKERILYLDVETTGLSEQDVVTVMSLYDGVKCRTYVRDLDLKEGVESIPKNVFLCTFNGTYFDLPFLRREFGVVLNQTNVDLRTILKGWGITGGLKRVAQTFAVKRKEGTEGLDGRNAVELWNNFQSGDKDALETLCAYNRDDVYVLDKLLKKLYNTSMRKHLFFKPV